MVKAIETLPNGIEIYDDRMYALIRADAQLHQLADGAVHSEGPVYFHEDDSVIWSDAHGNRLLRWSARDGVTVLRDPSDYQNGNARDLEASLSFMFIRFTCHYSTSI